MSGEYFLSYILIKYVYTLSVLINRNDISILPIYTIKEVHLIFHFSDLHSITPVRAFIRRVVCTRCVTAVVHRTVEDWQDENNLTLINRPNDAPTFYSRVWHTTSTPDIALCTEDLHRIIEREVGNQLGGSDHRPVYLTIAAKTVSAPILPRWNYKKANWLLYHHRTGVLTKNIHI